MKKGFLFFILLFLLTACQNVKEEVNTAPNDENNQDTDILAETELISEEENNPPIRFEAYTLEKELVSDEIFEQYPLTMVNVWATYCRPCLQEMPALGQLSRDRSDIQIIGIVADVWAMEEENETYQLAKEIVAFTEADYINIVPSTDLVHILMAVSVVPTTFFVDSNGNIVGEAILGALDKEGWEQVIEERLAFMDERDADE